MSYKTSNLFLRIAQFLIFFQYIMLFIVSGIVAATTTHGLLFYMSTVSLALSSVTLIFASTALYLTLRE